MSKRRSVKILYNKIYEDVQKALGEFENHQTIRQISGPAPPYTRPDHLGIRFVSTPYGSDRIGTHLPWFTREGRRVLVRYLKHHGTRGSSVSNSKSPSLWFLDASLEVRPTFPFTDGRAQCLRSRNKIDRSLRCSRWKKKTSTKWGAALLHEKNQIGTPEKDKPSHPR